jgi:hypothetical protein
MVGKNAENSASVMILMKSRTTAMINKIIPSRDVRQLENIRVFISLDFRVIMNWIRQKKYPRNL